MPRNQQSLLTIELSWKGRESAVELANGWVYGKWFIIGSLISQKKSRESLEQEFKKYKENIEIFMG